MRTTLDLNDQLLRQAKRKAAERGVPLRLLVEQALRVHLQGGKSTGKPYQFHWEPECGVLQPGVQIEDRDTLSDMMDGCR